MWPLEKDMDVFYGDPRGVKNPSVVNPLWLVENLDWCVPPFRMSYDGRPVTRFQAHRKVIGSLEEVFNKLWKLAGEDQGKVEAWGLTTFGGCYNYRLKRAGDKLSCHAFGAAIDLDPTNNAFHSTKFKFTPTSPVVQCFEAAGWEWGGRWSKPDAMHFQAARTKE